MPKSGPNSGANSAAKPGATDVTRIQGKLAARQARRAAVWVLGIVFGIPLMFLGPLVLGSMFWLAWGLLSQFYPWSWFFWGSCGVVIPVLLWTEIRTSGAFMSEVISEEESRRAQTGQAVRAVGTLINPRMSGTLALAAAVAAPRASMAGIIELFLTGPRMLLAGVRGFWVRGKLRGVETERAAMLLSDLGRATGGVGMERLLKPGEGTDDLELPLAYLVFYDWAGVAGDGAKAWMLTDARKELG